MVIVGTRQERVPFLRGILTRSLQDAGLSFEDSYSIASTIRSEIPDDSEITTVELRARVAEVIRESHGEEWVRRYEQALFLSPTIMVLDPNGASTPFSRGRHRLRLESCGLTPEEATGVAARLYQSMVEHRLKEIGFYELRALTHERLLRDQGPTTARRYLVWEEFYDSGRPLLVLLGGTVGCGKSTLASELAHVLEVLGIQSTDMLREVMRMMVPERLMPALHTSSFLAWKELPHGDSSVEDPEQRTIAGFLTQAESLSVASRAVIQRTLAERTSLILEGVHVTPSLVASIAEESDALVVPILLAVLKPRQLRERIRGRGKQAPDRRARRYLDHFDEIWSLQSHLLSDADRVGVPIVVNDDKERAISSAMSCILRVLSREFEGQAETVLNSGSHD